MDKLGDMNAFLREKLRAPTMTAHDTPTGGDTELTDAAAELAYEAGDTPYTPPLPVPIGHPTQRDYRYTRGLRSAVWLTNPTTISNAIGSVGNLVGGGQANAGEDFPINSIMVDNFTVAWCYWPEVGVWVPPFNYGRVFRFDGSRRKRVLYEQPAGLAAVVTPGTSQVAQMTRVTFYEELLPESPGQTLPTTNQ